VEQASQVPLGESGVGPLPRVDFLWRRGSCVVHRCRVGPIVRKAGQVASRVICVAPAASAANSCGAVMPKLPTAGAMTTFAAFGVVTAFGAIAAGCALLHDFLEHDTAPGPRRYLSLLRAASRGAIALLALPAVAVLGPAALAAIGLAAGG